MKINNFDISGASGKQWAVNHNAGYTIKNNSSWEAGAPAPTLLDGYIGNKKKVITIKVTGSTRADALLNCSKITGLCIGIVDIEFDNYPRRFRGNVTGIAHKEFDAMKRSHRLDLTVEGYEYSDRVSAQRDNTRSFTINNPGTIDTPAVLTIVPASGAVSITIRGFGRDIVLNNVVANEQIVIDGETGTATKGGKISPDIVLWQMPRLKPGNNAITVDNVWLSFNTSFKPMYS